MRSEDDMINNSEYTHCYEAAWDRNEHKRADDPLDYYTRRFERETKINKRARAEDVGGVVLYRTKGQLVAFYDYENLCGTVF